MQEEPSAYQTIRTVRRRACNWVNKSVEKRSPELFFRQWILARNNYNKKKTQTNSEIISAFNWYMSYLDL